MFSHSAGSHAREIQDTVVRRAIVVGVLGYDAKDLEEKRYRNEMIDIRALGMLVLTKDVTPELALATINSIKLFGVFQAPAAVKEALKDRIE